METLLFLFNLDLINRSNKPYKDYAEEENFQQFGSKYLYILTNVFSFIILDDESEPNVLHNTFETEKLVDNTKSLSVNNAEGSVNENIDQLVLHEISNKAIPVSLNDLQKTDESLLTSGSEHQQSVDNSFANQFEETSIVY